jgi:protease-4
VKRLVWVFAILLAIAFGAALLGYALRAGSPAALGGAQVLRLELSGDLEEAAPVTGFTLPGFERPLSFATVYTALIAARTDARIKGLEVSIDDPDFGLAKAQELRDLLASLEAHGKPVRCYMDSAGEGSNGTLDYYLASACGHLTLSPAGEVNLLGLFLDSSFLRGALEKLKIEATYAHAGKYKSAPETFTEYAFSPSAREALDALLDSEFAQLVAGVATARKLPAEQVRALIDRAPLTAETALTEKLVDALAYPDEFRAANLAVFGAAPRVVDLADYDPPSTLGGRRVAVMFAAGTIVRGRGGEQPWTRERYVGSQSLAEALAAVAEDDGVDAVVLRVDSPGGSALASDLIQRQIVKLQEKKPVVVSMADLAASGGYYIAARAKKIVAEPATLTGSIGVFAGKISTRRFQQELLGVSHDSLQRGANADFYGGLDPLDADQSARFSAAVEHTYQRFLSVVSTGRAMPREAVDGVAQGRVWTGEDALKAGLVDELGGLERAIELAGELAGFGKGEAVALEFKPDAPSLFEALFSRREAALPSSLTGLLEALAPRPTQALELPAEFARLSRPF